MNKKVLPDPQTLPYEEAKEELKRIVAALETGSVPLEESLELWQRGKQLADRCETILTAATEQIAQAEKNNPAVSEGTE